MAKGGEPKLTRYLFKYTDILRDNSETSVTDKILKMHQETKSAFQTDLDYQKELVIKDELIQASMEKLEGMCVNLVEEIIDKVEDAPNILSDKAVWSFMREYDRLKKREKHFR